MQYHDECEKADDWRVDLVRVRVDGPRRWQVLSELKDVLGECSGSRRPSGGAAGLPGSLTYVLGESCLWVQCSGCVAASAWFVELLRGLGRDEWCLRAVDWCCDFACRAEVVEALRSVCTSYIGDNEGGLTLYFGRVSRGNRRFTRVYLWRCREGGDSTYLRLEHCYRPRGVRAVRAASDAFLEGVFVGGGVGLLGERAEGVLRLSGVAVPERVCARRVSSDVSSLRARAVLWHLRRVRRILGYVDGVSGVGTLRLYCDKMIEVYLSACTEVLL
jgi:hypothetical protein